VISNIIRKAAFSEILCLLILILGPSQWLGAQNYDLKDYTVTSSGIEFENPMVGGFSAPQLNKIDFNQDGIDDLLVFDRRGDIARSFLHSGNLGTTEYTYAPRFQKMLPPISKFVKIVDYNQDGVPDIFTGPRDTGGNIAVYTGGLDGNRLTFTLYEVDDDLFPFDILTVLSNGAYTNVYNSIVDIPEIVDIDSDGDMDILSFEAGGSYIKFYKNMVIEEGLGLDTFKFQVADNCWGKFMEGGLDNSIFLGDNHFDCAEGLVGPTSAVSRGGAHAGSTIESFDYEADGDYDLLIGDLTSNSIVLIINDPISDTAFVTDFVAEYPSDDIPVDLNVFVSAWVLDIDNDGDEDFVACPNEESGGANIKNFWYYENISDTPVHDFQLIQKDLLNNTNIDLGTDANPVFLDYNQDGLIDLLIGTTGEYDASGQAVKVSMWLYENVGTIDLPAYNLVDDDWLKYSDNTMFSNNPTPAIGDLDGDGDDDLIVGDNNGFLYYYQNTAGPNNPYEFAQAIYKFMDIDVGQNVQPYIFDYNQDGMGDLFIGERSVNTTGFGPGNINYFQNMGSIGDPFFDMDLVTEPNTLTFGLINTQLPFVLHGSSAPVIFDLGGRLLILCGTETGDLRLYEGNYDDPNSEFVLLDEQLGGIIEGEETSIDLADIDSDDYLEVVVGNKRGGIAIYNTTLHVNGSVNTIDLDKPIGFDFYPNPSNTSISIESQSVPKLLEVYDIHGKKLIATESTTIDVSFLIPGTYTVKGTFAEGQLTKILIVH